MKIKTIKHRLDNADDFDKNLNDRLAEGYQLVRRDIVPGFRLDGGGYLHNMLYAELVLPDPPAEQETVDPIQALRQIKEICEAVTDSCDNCPIKDWCFGPLKNGDDPTDWILPEVEG